MTDSEAVKPDLDDVDYGPIQPTAADLAVAYRQGLRHGRERAEAAMAPQLSDREALIAVFDEALFYRVANDERIFRFSDQRLSCDDDEYLRRLPERMAEVAMGSSARDEERRFDVGNALGWELESHTPSWAELVKGIADLRELASRSERDQAHVALADQWRLDADNLRNADLPKSDLLTIAEHLDQAAGIVGGERP